MIITYYYKLDADNPTNTHNNYIIMIIIVVNEENNRMYFN